MLAPTGPVREFLPPPQREGESAAEYIERLEWHRSRLPAEALSAPIKGHISGSDGMKPWYRADYIGRAGSGEAGHEPNEMVFRSETVSVPQWNRSPIRKRTPQERRDEVRRNLQALAIQSYSGGAMRLPRSINEKLVRLGLYPNAEAAAKDSVEQVCQKFETYATALLERAARENGETVPVTFAGTG